MMWDSSQHQPTSANSSSRRTRNTQPHGEHLPTMLKDKGGGVQRGGLFEIYNPTAFTTS